ncbi:hypothetical protein HQ520_02635 [bacterium]|nr:hypothetical protein [bacterium]
MSASINPNTMYSKAALVEIIGESAFKCAQDAGLYAVGDRYLGAKAIASLAMAHDNVASQRAANRKQKGANHEEAEMATHRQTGHLQPVPRRRGAADVLRALEKAE